MKKVKFPIVERISTEGVVKQYEIHLGATLTCINPYCRKPFYADGKSAVEGKFSNISLVCPHCGYQGSTFYYARQKVGKIVV